MDNNYAGFYTFSDGPKHSELCCEALINQHLHKMDAITQKRVTAITLILQHFGTS